MMAEWRVATVRSFEMLQKKTLKAFCASIRECATGITAHRFGLSSWLGPFNEPAKESVKKTSNLCAISVTLG